MCGVLVFGSESRRPSASSRRLLPSHNLLTHTQLAHTQLVLTQLAHTHNLSSHILSSHNLPSHNLHSPTCPHTTCPHKVCSHTTCSDTTCPHTTCSHTTCPHTWHLATCIFTLRGRRGTYGIGLAPVARLGRSGTRDAAAVGVAGVALGDIHLRFTWQAWYLVTSTSTFCVAGVARMALGWLRWARLGRSGTRGRRGCWRGRRGTWWHRLPLLPGVARMALGWLRWRAWAGVERGDAAAVGVAGVALGDIHLQFAWQAWHLATCIFTLRGRRGTWLRWCAWAGVERGDAAPVGVAGVALGDIHLRFTWQAWYLVTSTSTFAWQAWHVWHWAGSGGALGPEWNAGTPRLLAWQAWYLVTSTSTFARRGTYGIGLAPVARLGRGGTRCWRGRRGTWWHPPSICVAGVALGDMYLRFAWQAWHLATSTVTLHGRRGTCGTGLALTPSLTHHFVTHHLSHTVFHTPSFTHNFVTHHFVTHHFVTHHFVTRHLCHTPSFTHNFVTHHLLPHHFVTHHLSHTIFYTPLCHTPSFTHHLTHIFVTHHLSHTTLSHTIFDTPSFTHRFVTHHLWHTTLSHTIFHTPSLTHHLSHTIFHTPLCHPPSFTYNFVTNNSSHTTCFTSRSSTTSFVFPALPVPLQHLLPIIGRSWHVGLSGPLILISPWYQKM